MLTVTDELDPILDRIIAREGGLSEHPADKGGLTKYGITWQTYKKLNPLDTEADLRALTKTQAKEIYAELYWFDPGFDQLGLVEDCADMVLDTSVHSGPRNATKMLQRAVCVKDDGWLGPITHDAVQRLNGPCLLALLVAERMTFLGRLITMDPTQAAFAAGWMNRLRDFVLSIPYAR